MTAKLARLEMRRIVPIVLLALAAAFFMFNKGEMAGASLVLGVVASLIS